MRGRGLEDRDVTTFHQKKIEWNKLSLGGNLGNGDVLGRLRTWGREGSQTLKKVVTSFMDSPFEISPPLFRKKILEC